MQVVCEVATLADAVTRAARVAPNKGYAFDKAAGILFTLEESGEFFITATDLTVSYRQRIATSSNSGESFEWRLPSGLIADVMTTLPMDTPGLTVTLTGEDDDVLIEAGTTKARLHRIISEFPRVGWFDPDGMVLVEDFATRVHQVAWATKKDAHNALTGVHIDGQSLIGCDGHNLAVVPCAIPFEEPITVPLRPLLASLKDTGPVHLRATETRLELMPDADTQMSSQVITDPYPNVRAIMRDEFSGEFTVERDELIEALSRILVLAKTERYHKAQFRVRPDLLRFRVKEENGVMTDECAINGGNDFTFFINPTNVSNSLRASRATKVRIQYGPSDRIPIRISDNDALDCYLMILVDREGGDD